MTRSSLGRRSSAQHVGRLGQSEIAAGPPRPIDSLPRPEQTSVVDLQDKKLGLLLSAAPDQPNFNHGIRLAETALAAGVDVYCYCIDDGVAGIRDQRVQALRDRGMKLHVCAMGAEKRGLPLDDSAVFSGLTVVSDLIANTDRFVSFN